MPGTAVHEAHSGNRREPSVHRLHAKDIGLDGKLRVLNWKLRLVLYLHQHRGGAIEARPRHVQFERVGIISHTNGCVLRSQKGEAGCKAVVRCKLCRRYGCRRLLGNLLRHRCPTQYVAEWVAILWFGLVRLLWCSWGGNWLIHWCRTEDISERIVWHLMRSFLCLRDLHGIVLLYTFLLLCSVDGDHLHITKLSDDLFSLGFVLPPRYDQLPQCRRDTP